MLDDIFDNDKMFRMFTPFSDVETCRLFQRIRGAVMRKPKHSIGDVIRFLEARQLEEEWDIRKDAIYYLREYLHKKDELEDRINEETIQTLKTSHLAGILIDILKEKEKEGE